jgi:hypothetical protein
VRRFEGNEGNTWRPSRLKIAIVVNSASMERRQNFSSHRNPYMDIVPQTRIRSVHTGCLCKSLHDLLSPPLAGCLSVHSEMYCCILNTIATIKRR